MAKVDGFRALADVVSGSYENRTDTRYATVSRIADDGTVYVRFPGGEDMPVHSTLATVAPGDSVPVTIAKGRATIRANATDLPASSTSVERVGDDALQALKESAAASSAAASAVASAAIANEAASQAVEDAATAKAAATQAQSDAADAKQSAADAAQDAASAASSAQSAQEDAQAASTAATSAQGSAATAATAAQQAQSDAADAASAAQSAQDDAASAQGSASQAAQSASTAQQQAAAATTAADEAKADAKTAKEQAASAVSDASTAKQAATEATATANGAVTALATVQGVVDTLEAGVDDLQTHVAMMDAYSDGHGGTVPAGLHVVPTGSGYFLVIANDGTYVYDAQSVLVTKFGESIDFSSTRPQRIGNETAYIEYYDSDNDGVPDAIRISGTNLDAEIASFELTVAETYATKSEAKQTDSDSGKREIITEDAAELPLLSLTAYGECSQDGTPTPDAPVEIKAVRSTITEGEHAGCIAILCTSADGTRESVSYIDLQGEEVDYLDEDYGDTLTVDASGHVVLHKRCRRKTIAERNGSGRYAAGVYWVRFNDMLHQDVTSGTVHDNTHPLLSTNFMHTTGSATVWTNGSLVGYFTRHAVAAYPAYNHYVFFRIADDLSNADFVEQYADVEIVYPLDEPYTIDLGYIDPPTTFDGGSVRVIAEIQPVIDASWWTKAGYEAGKAFNEGNTSADLTALEQRVTTAETSITQQAGQIQSKASQTEVNALSGRVSTAESAITQQAGQIDAKVSKDGVIAAINLSTETEGGSTAKIRASKVEIDGTAVFTAIKSQADAAYDAKGAATAVQENLDNLEIGGRNLLRNTNWSTEMIAAFPRGNTGVDNNWMVENPVTITYDSDNGLFKLVASSTGRYGIYQDVPDLIEGETYIFSVDVGDACAIDICKYKTWNSWTKTVLSDTGRYVVSFVAPSESARIYMHSNGLPNRTAWYRYPKLEKGNKATAWTPAPEDTDAAIAAVKTTADNAAPKANAVKRTQRIYYRKSASGAPDAPGEAASNWVTNGNTDSGWTKYNAWSTRIPPIAESKAAGATKCLYLYTCEQREMGDGTLAYTTVLLDDSTTVIDGENIITGSVTANQIAGHSVSADQLTVGVNDSIADAAKTASNYIAADSTGIRIANANPSTAATYQHQSATETEFVVKDKKLASFGETVRVGLETQGHVSITGDGYDYMQGNVSAFAVEPYGDSVYTIGTEYATRTTIAANSSGGVSCAFDLTKLPERPKLLYKLSNSSLWAAVGSEQAGDPVYEVYVSSSVNEKGETSITYGVQNTLSSAVTVTIATAYDSRPIRTRIGREDASHVEISPERVDFLDAHGKSFARVSDTMRIGYDDDLMTILGSGAFKLVDGNGTVVANINSENDLEGRASVVTHYTYAGQTTYTTEHPIDPVYNFLYAMYEDGTELDLPEITGTKEFTFATAPTAPFQVAYFTTDPIFNVTFGTRSGGLGSNSFAVGIANQASRQYAVAIGRSNAATNADAYAIGRANSASAVDSYAIGRGLKASSNGQMVIGKYNVEDTAGTYSFIIGNGTSDSDRSNIFTVNTDGYVVVHTENKENVNKGFRINDLSSAGRSLIVGIGKGTVNRGIYDEKLDRWMVYANDSTVYVNNIEIADSGWLNLPIASGWTAYSSDWTPRYRKKNGMVEVVGGIKPTSATTLGESVAVFSTLPSGYRPSYEFTVLCQGSGRKIWLLHIYADGRMSAERYRDMASSSYQSASTSEWLVFHATFFAD